MSTVNHENLRQRGITLLSFLLSLFILYTSATGPFESIIQRALFLAILVGLGVAATIIAAFTLFGGILLNTGGGQTFIDLAIRLGGRAPGGGAKIATIASGLFGKVSGSAVANVATTGNFTIPLMKRLGYPPAMAAGTEAVASTGGQLAPPIIGAAAFIMAEIIGVEYVSIMLAAALPAFMFYLGVFMTIDVMAKEQELGRLSDTELPPWKDIVHWRRLAPVVAALGALFIWWP